MDWFLFDRDLRHERVKIANSKESGTFSSVSNLSSTKTSVHKGQAKFPRFNCYHLFSLAYKNSNVTSQCLKNDQSSQIRECFRTFKNIPL